MAVRVQIAGMDGRRLAGSFRRAEDSMESGWGGVAWLAFFFWWGGELGLRIFLLQASGGRLCSVCSLSFSSYSSLVSLSL